MKMPVHIVLLAALLCVGGLSASAQDLTALEQRMEGLRAQLRDVTDKEATLQARMQQLDEELKPENIQNRAALTGTLNADAAREQVRKQIEGEQARVRQQLDLLATSHARLEAAISEAEAEAVRRRAAALAPTQTPTQATPTGSDLPTAAIAPVRARHVSQRRAPRRRVRVRRPARRK